MSTTIDQRVVEMRFDNAQFERNVQTSMSTLDRLKQSLNLTGASKGLESVNTAANKINFSGITSGIETVQVKFSYLQASIQHQLNRIVDSTVAAGKRMVSALTIDPIKTGFSEYETQINAVQTILANTSSKGTTLQQVNSALDTLNTYADKTIYNFTEMTRNIGTFTAAGVDLDKSVSAIQGIANLAAVSGSTSQQASTAMYQLSQALAAGRVSLMDWNSVVNAGMGGQVFQDALKQTAKTMGIVVDESKSFRESISGGDTWLSSDVLIKTLEQFTMAAEEGSEEWEKYKKSLMDDGYTEEQAKSILKMANTATDAATKVKTFTQLWDTLKESAQSGWTQTWEIIVGDFGEAKEFLTQISDTIGNMIGASAEARNELLSGGLSSGWKQLLGAGIADEAGYQDSIKAIAKEHNIAFDEIIKKTEEAGGTFQDALISCLKDGSITSDMMTESVSHLANSMRNMTEEERDAAGYTKEHIKSIEELEKGLKDGSISMDEFVKKMSRPSGRENLIQSLWNAFNGLMSIVKPIKEAFSEIFPPATGEQLYALTEKIRDFTSKLTLSEAQSEKLKSTFKGLFAVVDIGVTFIKEVVSGIVKLVSNFTGLGDGILDVTGSFGDWLTGLRDNVKETDIFGRAIGNVTNFLQLCIDKIKEFGSYIGSKFEAPGFQGFIGLLKYVWDVLTKIGGIIADVGVGIGNALANVLSSDNITSGLDIVNGGLLATILLNLKKFTGGLSNISELFEKQSFLENIKDAFDAVKDSLEAWQANLKVGTLLKIAGAVGILAASILVISMIKPEKLTASLGAITILFVDLMVAMQSFSDISSGANLKGLAGSTAAMIGLSTAILILATALKKIASLGYEDLAKGLLGVIGLTATMVLAMEYLSKNTKDAVKGAMQMILFAAAIKILGSACEDISNLSWEELARGLVGVGALMGAVVLFLNNAKLNGKAISTGVGMVVLAASIKILASACSDFAQMKWEEIGKGLAAIGGLLLELGLFTKLTGDAKKVISTGIALTIIAASMKIFASVVQDFSGMSWEEIGRGLSAMAGALVAVVLALKFMPKNMITMGVGLAIVSGALVILADTLNQMGGMTWDEIGRGLAVLGGSIVILAIGLNAMNGAVAGTAALIVAAGALAILAPILNSLGSMSWGEIAKGLASIAGTFVVLGVAALVLQPMIGTIVSLSASVALFGVACLAVGAGVTLISVGLVALATAISTGATAIVAGLTVIISGIAGLIPVIVQRIGEALILLCKIIAEGAPVIGEAIKALVLTIIDVLVQCIPALADGALKLIVGVMDALAQYTPQVIDALFQFLIGILDGIAANIPKLIQSAVNLFMVFFQGVIDALKAIDRDTLINGIIAVGLLSGLVVALAGIALLTPAAMVGVIGLGAVITELAIVLAAIGALSKIPGLTWLITEGGQLMEAIGLAIGQFIGGIVGGMMSGVSGQLPKIGADLSSFMTSVQPFIVGAKAIDATALDGVKALAGIILTLTAANILEGLTSWFTGGSSLSKFGEEIAAFAPCIKSYADTVKGIDASAVESSANAAKALAEMAKNLPNSGGVAGFFAGENDLSTFAEQLEPFGKCMKNYADAVSGLDADAVVNSATAAKALAELANNLPNSGGVAGFFAGENDISSFGTQLVPFGLAMKSYSDAIAGIDSEAIVNSATAGKALAELANELPNSGGVAGFFAGENDISSFGTQLVSFGEGMKSYADSISGIDTEAVTNSAIAAKTLAELANNLPNTGGVAGFFAGDNDISSFGTHLVSFGEGLSDYADSISDIDVDSVIKSATAGEALASLVENLPDTGGLKAFFTGDKDIGSLGEDLVPFGQGMKKYSDSIAGIDPAAITNSTTAAKSLLGLIENLPKSGGMTGGISAFFTGSGDSSFIADQLEPFGKGMKKYSDAIAGIDSEAVTNSVTAAKALSELANNLPNNGGLSGFLLGDNSIGTFGDMLEPFGKGMKKYSDSIAGMDSEAVMNSATAGKALTELVNNLPNTGGLTGLLTGENDISSFGLKLIPFGASMKAYSLAVSGIDSEAITNSVTAGKALTELFNNLPKDGGVLGGISEFFTGENGISAFISQLLPFGMGMKAYSLAVSGIDSEAITNSVTAGKALTELINNLPVDGGMIGGISAFFTGENSASLFTSQLVPFGMGMKAYSMAISGIDPEAVINSATAGKALVELANNLPNSGGVVGFFTGENDISIFSTQLVPFGKGMKQYADAVAGIDPESVNNSVTAAKALSELINNMPTSGGISEFFSGLLNGESDMSIFSTQLVPFGKGMKQYADAVAGIDPESVNNSVTAGKALAELASNLPNSGGLVSLFTGDSSIATLGTQLVPFGKGMKQYANAVAGIDASSVNNSVNMAKRLIDIINSMSSLNTKGVKSFVTAINELGETGVDKFIKAFNNSSERLSSIGMNLVASISKGVESKKSVLTTAAVGLISDMIEKIKGKENTFDKAGVNLLKALIKGIKSQKSDVTSAIKSSVSDGDDKIRGYYDNFYKAGSHLVDGFAAGIKANAFKAEAKAAAMAEAALAAAKEALDINSPSKEFRKIGYSVPEGFAMGIEKLGNMVTGSAVSMADTAINSVKKSIAQLGHMVVDDIDAQPTIRPVLDLSDVEAGAGAINGLFNSRSALGVRANVGAISTMMNRSGQNGANDDVVSAINKLRKDLGNIGGPTYNIGDVTYDNDSTVSTAVESLIRAVRVERRR